MNSIRRLLLLSGVSVFFLVNIYPVAANAEPQDIASYSIKATYFPETHTISAQEKATYKNTTAVAMPDIVLHLYLNAFRSAETLWMREAGSGFRGIQYDPSTPGWIDIENIHLDDGTPLISESVDADVTLVRIGLPEPVAPGDEVSINLSFTALLPRVFARTGWADDGEFVLAGQWFPKYGVWQNGAWNAYPFHANSEFYADFGIYNVSLTLPDRWVVAANADRKGNVESQPNGTATYTFFADHILDFVWTASPNFRQITHQHNGVTVKVLFYPTQRTSAKRALEVAIQGLDYYSQWYGPYGNNYYSHLTIVIVPPGAGGAGGMEYPAFFTVGSVGTNSPRCLKLVEVETIHELAHQWFQSVIATNEAEEPWLDEGFADYSTTRVLNTLYRGAFSTCGNWQISYLAMQRASYLFFPEIPMAGNAWDFGLEYSIATYSKPVVSLTTLENLVGEEKMLEFLQAYYKQYAFGHPTAQNLKRIMIEILGQETATWFFDQLVQDNVTMDAFVAEFDSDHIVLERKGELCVPTNVSLTTSASILRKTTTEEIKWSCDHPTLHIDGNYSTVEIDPQNKILLDLNLANNRAHRTFSIKQFFDITFHILKSLQFFYWGNAPW